MMKATCIISGLFVERATSIYTRPRVTWTNPKLMSMNVMTMGLVLQRIYDIVGMNELSEEMESIQ